MLFGATGTPSTPMERSASIVRVMRRPTSTGSRPLGKALLNVPSTRRSRRRSNPCIPTASVYECIASDSVR